MATNPDTMSITFDEKSLNTVLEALGTLPFNRVNQLISDIIKQVNAEVERRQAKHNELELPETPSTEVQ